MAVDPGRSAKAAARSVVPLVLGALGLLAVVGLGLGYVVLNRARPAPPQASPPTPASDASKAQVGALTQALVESQLKLAERDLEDKNYGGAIAQADSV
jgi:hypothetical protein